MADSFTALLRLRQQTTGANNNTWGALLNAAMFQLLEDSVAGRVEKVLAGADITLSTNNGASDEARKAIIALTGSPGATRNIIIPNVSKLYVFDNQTNAIQNVKTSAGAAFAIPVGDRKIIMCDGADNVFGVADTLGGLDASVFARRDVRNTFAGGNADLPREFTDGATITLDSSQANVWFGTLGGDRTVAITNPTDGSWLEIYATQDGTGGRDLTWPANVQWEGGVTPASAGVPNTTSIFKLRYFADSMSYMGYFIDDIATAGGGGGVTALTIDRNENNVDVFARSGSPAGPVTLTITIPVGVVIGSICPGTPALDFEGFAAASIINIINLGYIQGCGGEGGHGGASATMSGADPLRIRGRSGEAGGDAIRLPSTACTINITNGAGFVWGGGGGGGGGGGTADNSDNDWSAGGGGGGGAGGGRRGQPGSIGSSTSSSATVRVGNPGISGTVGTHGTFGTGGTGDQVNSATGGPGGDGGDWGAAGTAGTSPTTGAQDSPGGAAGAAGKAINVNGGTAPSFVSGSGAPHTKGAVS